jgi:hypothetical protein
MPTGLDDVTVDMPEAHDRSPDAPRGGKKRADKCGGAHLSCLQKRKHPGCVPSFLVHLPCQLLRPHQEGLFGRARPPGGPSPRDSERTVQKLPLRTGRPAVGPYPNCWSFASFPDLLSREVANNSDAPGFSENVIFRLQNRWCSRIRGFDSIATDHPRNLGKT